MNIHEEQFIRSFVVESKQNRYLDLIKTIKGRAKLTAGLDHCKDIRPDCMQAIPPVQQTPKDILAMLSRMGAGHECYVISSNSEIDGRTRDLSDALEEIVGYGNGSFISSIPGRLGYFESEEMGERF